MTGQFEPQLEGLAWDKVSVQFELVVTGRRQSQGKEGILNWMKQTISMPVLIL